MCKAGGPRCPQTAGKKSRRKFNDRVNRKIKSSGLETHDWKEKNPVLYDKMMRDAFNMPAADTEPDDVDYSWVNYRETGTRVTTDEDDENAAFLSMFQNEFGMGDNDDGYSPSYDDYGDLISEDSEDVNAFLNAQFAAEIEEAMRRNDEEEEEEEEEGNPSDIDKLDLETIRESFNNNEEEEEEPTRPANDDPVEEIEMGSNRHLIPEDATIISPNPNPVFVYGTLRNGQGNHKRILQNKTQKEKPGATLPGTAMYSNGGFPYVIEEEEGNGVAGDLIYLDYDNFADTMENLDWLEGTSNGIYDDDNHYNRVLRYVQTGDNEYTQAWVYIPPTSDNSHVQKLHKVESGDWLNRDA